MNLVMKRKTDYDGNLELKSIYGMQQDLSKFQQAKETHEILWKVAATPGDCKVSPLPNCEQPILLFVMSDTTIEAKFGSYTALTHWMRCLQWYTPDGEGIKAWEFAGGEEEGAAGGGKKKKKKK